MDLESWEMGLRAVVLMAGAKLLEKMVDGVGSGRRDERVLCSCGSRMESHGRKTKHIKTVLGEIHFKRSVFVCPVCGRSRMPGDEALTVEGTGFSPGVRRLMARAGSRGTFREGQEDLEVYANITVTAKDVERVAEGIGQQIEQWEKKERDLFLSHPPPPTQSKDLPLLYISYDGTGVPMVPWELEGRKGKQPDGSSKTREVKLGCVFTQTSLDEQQRPIRDEESTSYVGAIENAEEFGWRMYGEAQRRGLERAEKVVVLGDGARWVWNLADMHFCDATRIVDLYHAREHLYHLCFLLAGQNERSKNKYQIKWLTALDEGNIETLIQQAQTLLPKTGLRRKEASKEINYFKTNRERMRYADFRKQGFFVGSGVVEAGCKTVVSLRLKRPAMQWTTRGANSIISLRCSHISNRIEDFWEGCNA